MIGGNIILMNFSKLSFCASAPKAQFLSGTKLLQTICLFTVPFLADAAFAQAWIVSPSISLSQEYEDNYRLESDSPTDQVFTTVLTGSVEASRLTEIWDLRAFARYDALHYEGDDDDLADKHNQFAGIGSLYKTELGEWQLDGSYRRDTIQRTLDILIDPGEVVIDTGEDIDENLSRRQIRRERILIQPSWRRNLTELMEVELAYEFNDTSYDEPEEINIIDFTEHTAAAELFRDISPLTTVNATVDANFYRGDEDREFDNYSFLAGADHEFSELTRAGFALGFRFTSFDTPDENGDETGLVGRVYGERRAESSRVRAEYSRQLRPSGAGELLETDLVTLRLTQDLRPKLDLLLQGRFFRNRSDVEGSDNDRYYASFEPGLSYAFTQDLSVDVFYRYEWEDRDQVDDSATNHGAFISLNYVWPTLGEELR
jgi:hypothetical protein